MKGCLVFILVCLVFIQLIDVARGGRRGGGGSSSSSRRGGGRSYCSSSSSRRSYCSSSRSSGSSSSSSSNYGSSSGRTYINYGYGSNYPGYGSMNNGSTYSFMSKGYGTRWGTRFNRSGRNTESNKTVGIGVGAGFVAGTSVATYGVYHRYNKYRELMYRSRSYHSGYGDNYWEHNDRWGSYGWNEGYYNNYYLQNQCQWSCPYPAVCRYGFCDCDFGYTRHYGRCSRDWSRESSRPSRFFDPLSQPCTGNKQCTDYDFNLICNLNTSAAAGRCQCRTDMIWNAEEYECQLYLDVDCTNYKYDTPVDSVVLEAVEKAETRLEINLQPAANLLIAGNETDPNMLNYTSALDKDRVLESSLLTDIDPRQANENQITEAYCRDVDALSHEFHKRGIIGKDPSLGEYFLEAVDFMNRTKWRLFLPEDTDINQDGTLSDLEVQHKFNTYVGELFKLLDDDKNNSITEEEFRSLNLNISQLTKAVDIALENFPLRPFFLAADENGDGFYDQTDFIQSDPFKGSIMRPDRDLIRWDYRDDPTRFTRYPRYRGTADIWEEGGRFLFLADTNGDEQLSLEELATKAKKILTKILEVFDGNEDEKISLEDLTSPHFWVGSIHNLTTEIFVDLAAAKGELDLSDMKLVEEEMSRIWGDGRKGLKGLDKNGDMKLNAADLFWRINSREKAIFLLPMLSQKLDKNQDGKIQRQELTQFIDEMFDFLDMDKDGALTPEDIFSLLRKYGMNCLQVGALRSYMKVFFATVDNEIRKFLGYIFHQLDMDGNGQVTTQELESIHIPCHTLYNDDINPYNSSDPNAKLYCDEMYQIFFGYGSPIGELFPSFPVFAVDSGHYDEEWNNRDGYGNYGGYGSGGQSQPRRETMVDKMTKAACDMLY